jgi:hypothetical protein
LLEDLERFLRENNGVMIVVILLPTSAKDVFIMKLIQSAVRDEDGYYVIFMQLIKAAMGTLHRIKPNSRQEALFKGSTSDPEMLKFQVLASDLGFSDEKIVDAIPKMDEPYEISVVEAYKASAIEVSKALNTKDVVLPLIVSGGKHYKDLDSVPKTRPPLSPSQGSGTS